MDINIGPYKINQRTPYSKIRVIDKSGKDISKINNQLSENILKSYNAQITDPYKHFEIYDNAVDCISANATEHIDYLFLPEGVEEINDYAFSELIFILIHFPSTLKVIGENAFYDCEALEYIDIPDTVEIIKDNAFEACKALMSVRLPSGIKKINDEVFCSCTMLQEVFFSDTIEKIGISSFFGCNSIKRIDLPKNLKIIDDCAFKACENLEEINFPPLLEEIGAEAFCNTYIMDLILPDTVRKIGEGAFASCEYLEIVKLPENLTKLSEEIFEHCGNLKNIILPDAIETIEPYVFYGTNHLTNINIPKNLKSIASGAFNGSSLKSLTFNHDLKEVEINSYYGGDLISNTNIEKLIINKSVKKIAACCFDTAGDQISKIDYLGTKSEFETFKKENKELFKMLPNIKEINFIRDLKIEKSEDRSR